MDEITEVVKRVGTTQKITEVFGISKEMFIALSDNVEALYEEIATQESTEYTKAIRFFEEVMGFNDYTSEQLLRFGLLIRNLRHDFMEEGKMRAMQAIALLTQS